MVTRRSLLAATASVSISPDRRVLAQQATPAAGGAITEEFDVVYDDEAGQKLDTFRPPAREAPRPAVLIFPGWAASRRAYHDHARALAAAGYVAFVVNYRRAHPGFLDDAFSALAWVRANAAGYGLDPARIGSYGHSSGGLLAAMLGVRTAAEPATPVPNGGADRVRCVIDLAGPNDLTIADQGTQGIGGRIIGGSAKAFPEAYKALSPVTHVDAQSAPFLLIQSRLDTIEPVEHAQRMAQALQTAGVEVVFAFLGDGDHLTVAEWAINGPFALAFFARHLRPDD